MDTLLAFITLTIVRLILPFGTLLVIGEWLRRKKYALL